MNNIKRLYIEPSSKCNFNCRICFRNNWINEKSSLMPYSVIERIYDCLIECKNIESVMLAGMGEPLLNRYTPEMVQRISNMKINTELLTNGALLSNKMSEILIKNGLRFLWVSVDSSHINNIKTDEINIFKNIRYFSKIKPKDCKLGISFTFENYNYNADSINETADELGADEINLSHIVPCMPMEKKVLGYDNKMPVGKVKRITDDSCFKKLNYCPFVENDNCFIKYNGDVSPCMQLLHSSNTYLYREKRIVNAASYGNILKKSLYDIWKDKEYVDFRKRVKDFEFPDCTLCDGCDNRLENKTDCMYNTFPTCGACLWAQNIARCP